MILYLRKIFSFLAIIFILFSFLRTLCISELNITWQDTGEGFLDALITKQKIEALTKIPFSRENFPYIPTKVALTYRELDKDGGDHGHFSFFNDHIAWATVYPFLKSK